MTPSVTAQGTKGCVDYCMHSAELQLVSRLELLAPDTLRQHGGLPTMGWSSDHMALVMDLCFTEQQDQPNKHPTQNAQEMKKREQAKTHKQTVRLQDQAAAAEAEVLSEQLGESSVELDLEAKKAELDLALQREIEALVGKYHQHNREQVRANGWLWAS